MSNVYLFFSLLISLAIVGWNLAKATDRIESKLEEINSKLNRIERISNEIN